MSDKTPQPGTEAGTRNEIEAALHAAETGPPKTIDPPESTHYGVVEVERDQRVKRIRNKGLRAYMPGHRFKNHIVKLRPQQHGALSVKRQEWTREIRDALGLKKKQDMHAAGNIELNRRLVLYTMMTYEGAFSIGGKVHDLGQMGPEGVRNFFQQYYLPAIDLSRPDDPEIFDEFDMELLNIVLEKHDQLDVVPFDVLDAKKDGFVLGAPGDIDFSE